MLQKLSIFNGILLVVSAIFLGVNAEVSTSEAINETDSLTDNKTMSSNKTSNDTSTASSNKTIILNVAEIGDEEQYRWVDASGAENPTLNIMANKEYNIKISNPTDEEHQLIIDSKPDGKSSEIAKSKEIKPDSKNVELNFKTDQVGELGYHCKYHPEMMNGTINVTQ
jgi:plastocyanin